MWKFWVLIMTHACCRNAILLCDGRGCKVALHQQCCGIADIPEGDWLCDGCEAAIKPEAHACLVCPVSGGALRMVASSGPVKLPEGTCLRPLTDAASRCLAYMCIPILHEVTCWYWAWWVAQILKKHNSLKVNHSFPSHHA